MNLSNAPEVASRTGVVQTQSAAPKIAPKRDDDTVRLSTFSEENEEYGQTAAGTTAPPPEKKIGRRDTRRRRQARVDQARTETGREVEGRKKSGEAETATRAEETRSSGPIRRPSNWTPERGRKTAQQLLNQQALLNQASIRFEQQRGPTQNPQSPFGQQQAMLDSLINMTEMLYHQHTGDKAGEIFTRPATRQLLTALKGLKNNAVGAPEEQAPSEPKAPRRTRREFAAQLERVERVHRALEPTTLPADYEPLDLVA